MNTEPVTRAIVLRLYLNRAQRSALRRWQGGLRRAWNDTLDLCFKRREREGKWPNKAAIQNFVVGFKKQEATVWMAEIPAHALLALADDMHRERGVQELAAVPSPVPLNELRILKRGSEKRACVMYRFTEVNNSEQFRRRGRA